MILLLAAAAGLGAVVLFAAFACWVLRLFDHASELRNLQPETWANAGARYRTANGGWGMCNTGYGWKGACVFGGIGCNVDHLAVARRNREQGGIPIEDRRLMFTGLTPHGEIAAFIIPRPSSGVMTVVRCAGCGEKVSDELYPADDIFGMEHYHTRCVPVSAERLKQ